MPDSEASYPSGGPPDSSSMPGIDVLRNPKSDTEIIASLRNDVTAAEWILRPLHRTWYEENIWTYGQQHMDWNARLSRFYIRPTRGIVPRATTNLILPKVEIGMQIFLDSIPKVKCVPTTPDVKDRDAAEAGTGILQYRDLVSRWSQKRRELAAWVVINGTGYVQATLDKANAEKIQIPKMIPGPPDPLTGEPSEVPELDPETGEAAQEEVLLADEGTEVISPFEIVPDWQARHISEWRRYTHVRTRSRDWIGRVYGSAMKKACKPEAPTGVLGTMAYYPLKMLDLMMRAAMASPYGLPYGYGGAIADFKYMEDSVIVITRWELPSDENPDGRVLSTAGGQVLDKDDYPYGNELNLFQFGWSILPGSLMRFGMVRNLLGPQKRVNGIDTQIDANRKTMGNARILSVREQQISLDTQSAEPAHIYSYKHKPGAPEPHVMAPSGVDPAAYKQREMISQDMDYISGVPRTLAGENPPNVTSAIQAEYLTEQAGKRHQACIDDNREEFKRLYQMRLDICRKSNAWKWPREIPMIGQDGKRQSRSFEAADFTGNMVVDIEVVPMAALSGALKKQQTTDLIGQGLIDITSPQNREKLRAVFGASEFGDPIDVHLRRAQEQNERLFLGQPVQWEPFDKLEVHIPAHIEAMKTGRFESLPPELKQRFVAHILEDQQHAKEEIDAANPLPPPVAGQPGAQPGGPGLDTGPIPGAESTPMQGPEAPQ